MPSASCARDADWRFLLPSPAGRAFEHMLLLGGSAELEATLYELGVARRISRDLRRADRADAVIVLAGASESIADAVRSLDENGVLYWEIDRRSPGQLALGPARALKQLGRLGLTAEHTYWVKPGFSRRQMYIPVDAPNAVRWYLDTLFRPMGIARRLLRRALRAIATHGRGIAAVVPCYAVTAIRGRARHSALLEHAADQGIPVSHGVIPVLIAQGDYDWNRIAILLFEPRTSSPAAVVKLPRRAAFNAQIEWEHNCLSELHSVLPQNLAQSLPVSALFAWDDLSVVVQRFVTGPNLHSRVARGMPHAIEDLQLAADWLTAFHASTATSDVPASEWLRARVEQQIAEYRATYGVTAAEQQLFDALSRQIDALGTLVPLVWQHADFGPWNLYRDGDHLSVIDWETARRGPPLADLLYFVTHWAFEYTRRESEEEHCRYLRQLFCDPLPADRLITSIRSMVAHYIRGVGVAPALLPTLIVYTFLEQAVDRMRRLRTAATRAAADRTANCYVAYLGVLAENAERWFARPPISSTASEARITVAVATRNRPAELARCVEAVLAGETVPAEIVIIDQSDDNRTAELVMASAWSHRVPIRYAHVTSRGLAASRNAAVARATAPVVAFTDDDCVPDARWLAAVAAAFEGTEKPDAVTGRILPLGPERPGYYAVAMRDSSVRAIYSGRALPWVVGSGGNTAITREWLARVGGFDERLGAGAPGRAAEDMDLLYRLLRAGATVRYEPDAVVFHERQDEARQMATRPSYGFGMGAFCGICARRRDAYAVWMLSRWCVDRARRLAGGCVRRRWRRVREEVLMLAGACRGVSYGLSVRMHE